MMPDTSRSGVAQTACAGRSPAKGGSPSPGKPGNSRAFLALLETERASHVGTRELTVCRLIGCRLSRRFATRNNHWNIIRKGGDYYLRPPVSIDPNQVLRPMPSQNPLMADTRNTERQKQAS